MSGRGPNVSDDEILAWWEDYLVTRNVALTAERFGRSEPAVRRHLRDLGVLEETPPVSRQNGDRPELPGREGFHSADPARELRGSAGLPQGQIDRILRGDWTASETRIADALRKLASVVDTGDDPIYNRPLPYVNVLPHAMRPGKHTTVIQSARQRGNEAMASGRWRKEVRGDLAAAGLMTVAHSRSADRYWH